MSPEPCPDGHVLQGMSPNSASRSSPRVRALDWTGRPEHHARAALGAPRPKLSASLRRGVSHQLGEHPRRTRAGRDAVAPAQTGGIATSCPRGQIGVLAPASRGGVAGRATAGLWLEPRRLLARAAAPGLALALAAGGAGAGSAFGGGLVAAGQVLGDGDRAMTLTEGVAACRRRGSADFADPGSEAGGAAPSVLPPPGSPGQRGERLRGPAQCLPRILGGSGGFSFASAVSMEQLPW